MKWEFPFINMSILKLLSERSSPLGSESEDVFAQGIRILLHIFLNFENDHCRLAVKKWIPLVDRFRYGFHFTNFWDRPNFQIRNDIQAQCRLESTCSVNKNLTEHGTRINQEEHAVGIASTSTHTQSAISTITTTSLFTLLYPYPSLCLKGTSKCFANISQQWGGVCANSFATKALQQQLIP